MQETHLKQSFVCIYQLLTLDNNEYVTTFIIIALQWPLIRPCKVLHIYFLLLQPFTYKNLHVSSLLCCFQEKISVESCVQQLSLANS